MSEIENQQIHGLNTVEWQQILSLFDELAELSSNDQLQQLNTLHLSQTAKILLQKMLQSQHQPNILDQTIDPLVEALLGEEAVSEHINPADIMGRTFGVWKATAPLGTGGMGQVFVAERADGQFEKQVALKVIKSGQFSELSQQRFLAEMQILAKFEHPHIAHLIDGGTSEDGITYFVMELISGEPIVDYANANQLCLSERIKLILQVIDAVEYAHQNLVIHGDIKPANVLVGHTGVGQAGVNESAQVKLVDFGIARSLEDQKNDSYLPQFTPSYSAPEQAQGQVLTTASDVFGLCAVLYELCTGSSPRKNESLTTHVEFNAKLNTPITAAYKNFQANQSHQQSSLKATRNKDFEQALSQELGAIIDKGLQIDLDDRYKNTTELRRDLLLFLEGSPVANYADNWFYRWRKLVAKKKLTVTFSAMALTAIVVAGLVAINQARLAQLEANKANWVNQFLLGIFAEADPVKNQLIPITVNELTGLAAEKILNDSSDNELKITSLELLSQIQHRLGEVKSSQQLNAEQIKLLAARQSDHLQLAAAHVHAGQIMVTQNDFEQSSFHFKQAMKLAPLRAGVNEQSVNAAMGLADTLILLDQEKEAEPILLELASHEDKVALFNNNESVLATFYMLKSKLAKANFNFDQALADITEAKTLAAGVSDNAMLFPAVLMVESNLYFEGGQLLKAEEIDRQLVDYFSEKFGKDHPETIDSLSNLAVSLLSLGKIQESIDVNLELIAILNKAGITDHQEAASYLNLGIAYDVLGEYHKAIENLKIAEKMWPTLTPRYLYYDALTYVSMARSLLALADHDSAEKYFKKGLGTLEQEYGVDNHRYAWFEVKYSALLIKQGKLDEAEALITEGRKQIAEVYGETGKRTALTDISWAQLKAAQGDSQGAKQKASKALQVLDLPNIRDRYSAEVAVAKKLLGS